MDEQLSVRLGRNTYILNITHQEDHLLIRFKYNKNLVEEIKNLDGANWDSDRRLWVAKRNERNLYWLRRFAGERDERYDEPAPDMPTIRDNLYAHQRQMTSVMHHSHRVIIAGDMGVGKTLAAIELMDHVGGLWWIVAPKTAEYVWKSELKKWNAKVRPEQILSYAQLDRVKVVEKDLNIIYDEGHALANWKSKRTQAAFRIAQQTVGYIIILSGTPQPREPTNWWSLCEICQPGFLREPNPNKFKYRLGIFETNIALGGHEYKALKNWIPEELAKLPARLGGMVHKCLKKDCLDLPEKIYNRIDIPFDAAMKGIVQMIVSSQGTGVKTLQRLRQLSDGFDYRSYCYTCHGSDQKCPKCEGKGYEITEHKTPKDDVILDFLKGPENRLVIYAAYRKSIDKIVRLCSENEWEYIRVDGRGFEYSIPNITLERFQSDDTSKIAFIGHPESGGQGFTLNKSENTIFYSNDFNAKNRWQAEDRIHRIGTTKAVIHDLCWLPTDRYILENLLNKRDLLDVALGELEEYVAKDIGEYYR